MQGADLTACTHPHRGVICACHRKDAHSVPAQGLNALTTRPVWSRLSRSHSDAAWSALKRSRDRAVFVRLTLALVVRESRQMNAVSVFEPSPCSVVSIIAALRREPLM